MSTELREAPERALLLQTYIPADMLRDLKELSRRENRPMAQFVRKAIRALLDAEK